MISTKYIIGLIGIIFSVFLIGCTTVQESANSGASTTAAGAFEVTETNRITQNDEGGVGTQNLRVDEDISKAEVKSVLAADSFDARQIKTASDGTKYIVDPKKIRGGGPPKDGIPSIDNPEFVTVADADRWIADNELVLAMIYKGVKRVYPLQILVWHEIVNDNIAGDPILITYCPLCGSGIAYDRRIDGEEVKFGTSGKLYNSNLVMYDRKTDTYWSQIDGLAIIGELTGKELKEVSIDTVVWRDWKVAHTDSEVLSQKTGFFRQYGTDPYGNYYEDSYLIFPVENEDNRIHAKTVIFGIEVNGVHHPKLWETAWTFSICATAQP